MSAAACPACEDATLRAIADALSMDDLERAMTLGLLDAHPESLFGCCDDCRARADILIAVRNERRHALAARERYRARQERLAERAAARVRKREAAAPLRTAAASSLPPAAAAALARAKARVAAKRPQD